MMDMGQDATSVAVAEVGAGMGVRNRFERTRGGTSLVVQWLRLCVPKSREHGLVGDLRFCILHVVAKKEKELKEPKWTFQLTGWGMVVEEFCKHSSVLE